MEPIVFHYMMISLTAMLAGFGPEMRVTSRVRPQAPAVVASYWTQVENMVFGRSANANSFRNRKLVKKRGTRSK
jgi:TetR/AcrR family transcriptional regulator